MKAGRRKERRRKMQKKEKRGIGKIILGGALLRQCILGRANNVYLQSTCLLGLAAKPTP